MKQLLFLLLFSCLCNAQQEFKNYTKVTVCRLVNTDEGSPCSIEYFAKKLKRTGHYIQAMESFNDSLAYNLLRLKAEAKSWNKQACDCGEEAVRKALVPNMFIIEVNNHKDTIFTTIGNKAVFFPKEQQQYTAPENNITSIFPKDVTDYFIRDFTSEISAWKMDSIPAKSILLRKKPIYDLTRKEFEKDITYFNFSRTDSVYIANGKLHRTVNSYYLGETKFSFDAVQNRISEVVINKTQDLSDFYTIEIDGVKIGDSEEVLCNKYDNSTLLKNWDAPLSAINNYYTYEVYLDNLEGLVRYTIRNKIIYSIYIEFKYPNGMRKKKKK